MTPIPIHPTSRDYGRCPAFWAAAVHLGLLRATRLCPLTVMDDELRAFADGLDVETIRKVNAHLRSKRPHKGKKPALPVTQGRGRRPGSGYVKHIMEGRETLPGAGGTGSGAPSGVAS